MGEGRKWGGGKLDWDGFTIYLLLYLVVEHVLCLLLLCFFPFPSLLLESSSKSSVKSDISASFQGQRKDYSSSLLTCVYLSDC